MSENDAAKELAEAAWLVIGRRPEWGISGYTYAMAREEIGIAIAQADAKILTLRSERDAARATVERVQYLVNFALSPWGAGKAAEWEGIAGDRVFTIESVLAVIRTALAASAREGE